MVRGERRKPRTRGFSSLVFYFDSLPPGSKRSQRYKGERGVPRDRATEGQGGHSTKPIRQRAQSSLQRLRAPPTVPQEALLLA